MKGKIMIRYFKITGALVCFLLVLAGCGSTSTHTITSFSPVGASAGTQITIYGTGFDSNPSNNLVAFTGAQPVPATSSSATMIVVTVPTGAATGVVMTSTDGGPEITSPASFIVLAQPAFYPNSGSIGTTITITGTNFDPTPTNNVVTFNGIPATVISSSPTQIVTTVPTGATNGPIVINVDGGTYILTAANSFSISQ
jgi:hypothetical protein